MLRKSQLVQAFRRAGYDVTEEEAKTFIRVKRVGISTDQSHKYLVACKDGDAGNAYYLTHFYVFPSPTGSRAEPDSLPFMHGTRAEVMAQFKATQVH